VNAANSKDHIGTWKHQQGIEDESTGTGESPLKGRRKGSNLVKSLKSMSEPRPKSISALNQTFTHSIGGEGLYTKRKPGERMAIDLSKKSPVANNKKGNKIIPIITRSISARNTSPGSSLFSPYKLKKAKLNYCSTIQKCSLEEIEENEESAKEI
jgi:hypothetical protein